MNPPLDMKVHGTLIKNKDGQEIPADEFLVFRPADNALLPTLLFYRSECSRVGCAAEQLDAVTALIERVRAWRTANAHRLKAADVEPGELR